MEEPVHLSGARRGAGNRACVVLLLVASTCGVPPRPGGEMRVEEAVARGARGDIRLSGFLVGRIEGEMRLCAEVLQSYPPQCGGSSVVVQGLRRADVPNLRSDQGGLWSDGEVELAGSLENGVLTVSAKPE